MSLLDLNLKVVSYLPSKVTMKFDQKVVMIIHFFHPPMNVQVAPVHKLGYTSPSKSLVPAQFKRCSTRGCLPTSCTYTPDILGTHPTFFIKLLAIFHYKRSNIETKFKIQKMQFNPNYQIKLKKRERDANLIDPRKHSPVKEPKHLFPTSNATIPYNIL